jgi:isopentenyl-diphosphate delta-isomerase
MTANSPENSTFVILVDENDHNVGVMEKLEAHHRGTLHRAVSVFIFNSKREWILQKRALGKYHSNGLWSNTCCTHPYPGETSHEAANRRLSEEMGIVCPLIEVFSFTYREPLDNGLTEHELDHVFIGYSDTLPQINKEEVQEWKAVSFNVLNTELIANPDLYTVWFKKLYQKVSDHLKDKNSL